MEGGEQMSQPNPTPRSELQMQAECFQHHWNTYPNERGLLHANNNNSHNAIKGNQNKALGIVKGVSDMEYFKSGQMYFLEFKTPEGTQSKAQKEFQRQVEAEGGIYLIIRSFEQFKEFIKSLQTN